MAAIPKRDIEAIEANNERLRQYREAKVDYLIGVRDKKRFVKDYACQRLQQLGYTVEQRDDAIIIRAI